MRTLIKGCIFFYLAFYAKVSLAQQVFYFEPATAALITAATYDHSKNAVMFFSSNNVFYYPLGSDKTVAPEWYSMEAFKNVDAALEWDDDNSLIFNGSSYRMFKHSTGEFVTENTLWPGLPPAWNNKLDGAVKWDNDLIFFFYNNEYVTYSISSNSITGQDNLTNWNGWPTTWKDGIDDAFNPGDGFIYFIRAGEMMPYSIEQKTFFAPKQISALNSVQNSSIPPGFKKASDGNTVKPPSLPPSTPSNNQTDISTTVSSNNSGQENQPVSLSGCITGSPAGSGLREVQSPIEGDQQGRLFYDNLPKGHRIAEIKIYTSKIWGKTVISGMQTVLLSPAAKRIEQTVLGRKTISENIFALDDDECITGITGTKNGESGNFIYSLQILTSKRSSPLYGERSSEKGRESFNLAMPDQSVFNGFVGNFNNNMTGIGIKYYGQPSMAVSSSGATSLQANYTSNGNKNNEAVNNQVSVSVNGSQQAAENPDPAIDVNAPQQIIDAYLDNYVDFIQSDASSNLWSKGPMPGIDWLGSGFDILKFDPLRPNETKNRKVARAIVITHSSERGGNEAQFVKPYGTEFASVSSGSDIDSNSFVRSYKEFANTFSISGKGKVSVPELAGGSLSASYEEMNSSSLGSDVSYHFSKIIRKIHEVDLLLTWKDDNTGQKYKQKIKPGFKDDVAALPVIKGIIPSISINGMRKNQPLGAEIERIKTKYLDFIEKYGTHFASHVSWGGQYILRSQLKRSDYEAARMTKQNWEYEVEAQIKKVKVENSGKMGNEETGKKNNSKTNFKQLIIVQGGNGLTDLGAWQAKLEAAPAPVEFSFTAFADLLTKDIFSYDPDIEKKSEILKIITEKYLVDNMRPPVESKDDFFRPLPDLPMPGNISVKNGGGYIINFSITYEKDGVWKTEESGNFTYGRTLNIEIPEDARKIKLKVNLVSISNSVIFEENFEKPDVKCFKVWGTIFSQGHSECDK